eukprot:symbB.v1.2.037666.t1/scaffold5626.1/size25186/2
MFLFPQDALKEGPKGVRTDRPPELAYVYNGQIEDEKWEENANFQASIVVQVPVEVAFDYVLARSHASESHQVQATGRVGPTENDNWGRSRIRLLKGHS